MKDVVNIRKSRQLIEILENSDIDKNMSVKDLLEKASSNIEKYEENLIKQDNKVIKRYTNVYLKFHNNDSMFGTTELSVMYINSINPESYTDRWERTYALNGDIYNFNSTMGVNHREFESGHVNSSYTEKQLKEYTQIPEEEYLEYVSRYNAVHNALQNIVNH